MPLHEVDSLRIEPTRGRGGTLSWELVCWVRAQKLTLVGGFDDVERREVDGEFIASVDRLRAPTAEKPTM